VAPRNEELIQACRRGDPLAWEALIGHYQRLIFSIPYHVGLDKEDSTEVVQRVFEKLVKHLNQLEQPDRVRAWLVTTARRESLRLIQRQNLGLLSIDDDDLDPEINQLPGGALLPDEMMLRREEQYNVRQAVKALDGRCRCLLALLFYRSDPPPYAEVAVALGMAEGSIGPIRGRCLEKLRRMLINLSFILVFEQEYALFWG
jgi:RNA polymerase sigma factor (sigma-70 family)